LKSKTDITFLILNYKEIVMGEKTDKEALKELRSKRKTSIERAKKAIKTQNNIIKTIKEQIKTEGKTVPEIAQATNISTNQVLLYVATLRKYGVLTEGAKDGDYFKYLLAG
jgi:Fic family protein